MTNKPSCNHTSLEATCGDCQTFQKLWYSRLGDGFRDIEGFVDTVAVQAKTNIPLHKLLHQPVPVRIEHDFASYSASESSPNADYFSAAYEIFHKWQAEKRSIRDCLVAELYARQDGRTGTERGIASILKKRRLKPDSATSVHRTIATIDHLIKSRFN